ncbi:hypothetical protein CFC21_000979, partial [Triticum aestivum]
PLLASSKYLDRNTNA